VIAELERRDDIRPLSKTVTTHLCDLV
jgi:hypothetical protein